MDSWDCILETNKEKTRRERRKAIARRNRKLDKRPKEVNTTKDGRVRNKITKKPGHRVPRFFNETLYIDFITNDDNPEFRKVDSEDKKFWDWVESLCCDCGSSY